MAAESPDGQILGRADAPSDDDSSVLADLSRLLHEDAQSSSGLARVLAHVIGPAAHVSVTIGPPVAPRAIDSNGQLAQHFDALQMGAGEGPCQSAWEIGDLVHTGDLQADLRWPRFSAAASDEPVVSVVALPVRVDGDVVGVINGYSSDRGAFESLDLGLLELAAFAASQVIQRLADGRELETVVTNLRRALLSRATIDQAKGVLMAHHDCDSETAFSMLCAASQQRNVKVRDLAEQITRRPGQPPDIGSPTTM